MQAWAATAALASGGTAVVCMGCGAAGAGAPPAAALRLPCDDGPRPTLAPLCTGEDAKEGASLAPI